MKFKSNKAIGIGVVGTGFMYNKKVFEENKWPAPASWNELADPKYRKKLVIPPLNNTYGLHALVMVARMKAAARRASILASRRSRTRSARTCSPTSRPRRR